jgi:Na+/proline symporter
MTTYSTKRINCPLGKRKRLERHAKEIILKQIAVAKLMIKIMSLFHFILNYLPKGLIGLLLAVIISAAMSSTASGLNALASTTAIDIYKRNLKEENQKSTISTRQSFYLVLGVVAILFFASVVPYSKT